MRGNIRLNNPAQSKSEIVMRDIVVAALIIFFLVFFILPIIAVLFGSFYRWNPLKNQMIYLGLDNWKKVFTSDLFWLSMKNTFGFAAVATIFRIVIGLALSCAIFSRLIIFHRIIIPQLNNAIVSMSVFQFLWAWDDYLWPFLMIRDTEKQLLPVALNLFSGQYSTDYAGLFAATSIAIIPVVIFYIIFQKKFIAGVSSSAIKG